MKAQFILGLLSWLFVYPAQALEDLIKNGSFEGTVSQNHWKTSGDIRANSEFGNGRNSRGYAYLSQANGAPGNNLSGTIYQEVEVPKDTLTATLIFWHYITTDGTDNSDKLVVSVRSKSGTELKRVTTLYAANKSTTYQQHPGIELAEYAGKTIRIHFEATTDSKVPTTFRIDDVSLLVIRREDDLEAPEILRFYPRESVYKLGEKVVFEYRVRDQGGSGVRTVTLSRSDTTADETHPSWSNLYVAEIEDDGNGDFKIGDFTDTPPVGTYWYTITVKDKAGNRKTASQEGLGPDQVTVKGDEEDGEYPAVTSFEAAEEEATTGTVIDILFKAVDEGSGLEFVELYSNTASNDPADGGWVMHERKTFSGELEASGEFSVSVKSGSQWFDLKIGDRAGNVRMATEQAISPIRIVGTPVKERINIRVTATPRNWGSVKLDPAPDPDGYYPPGTVVKIDAMARDGFALRTWRGLVSAFSTTVYAASSGDLEAVFEVAGPVQKPEVSLPKVLDNPVTIVTSITTKEGFCYWIRKSESLQNWENLKHICGTGQKDEVVVPINPGQTQQLLEIQSEPSVETGITFKLPLPGGRAWRLNTEVGDRAEPDEESRLLSHTGTNYYSLDFDNSYIKDGRQTENSFADIPVLAAAGGKVYDVGEGKYDGTAVRPKRNGHFVVISHGAQGGAQYFTRYLHLVEKPTVKKGDPVNEGDIIGYMGNSGLVPDGSSKFEERHLHFGVQFMAPGSTSGSGEQSIEEMGWVRLEDRRLSDYYIDALSDDIPFQGYYRSTNRKPE